MRAVKITLVREAWRSHPLAWIHRGEARAIAAELRRVGHEVNVLRYGADSIENLSSEILLLRLSDPVMLAAVQALTCARLSFIGPSAAVMARCYDKYQAHRIAAANSVECPSTSLANAAGSMAFPLMLKPRRSSDSLGVRLLRGGPIPARFRTEAYIAQEYVHGTELTVAVLHGHVGMPLQIHLPEGTPYSFLRKYLLRAPRSPLADAAVAARVRDVARRIAEVFGVNWAARIDLIHEKDTGRLRFLECDVAPLVGTRSAFATSLEAAGIERAEQLRLLLSDFP
jgi:D-alanine-D-alanine ligase-like ATP-grasp enzyme